LLEMKGRDCVHPSVSTFHFNYLWTGFGAAWHLAAQQWVCLL